MRQRRAIELAGRRFVLTDADAETALRLHLIDPNAALVLATNRQFAPPLQATAHHADPPSQPAPPRSVRRC